MQEIKENLKLIRLYDPKDIFENIEYIISIWLEGYKEIRDSPEIQKIVRTFLVKCKHTEKRLELNKEFKKIYSITSDEDKHKKEQKKVILIKNLMNKNQELGNYEILNINNIYDPLFEKNDVVLNLCINWYNANKQKPSYSENIQIVKSQYPKTFEWILKTFKSIKN